MIWNFFIRRPVLAIVIFVILGIFGVWGFLNMPVQENPDIEFPIVSVNVVLPGASPEVIETEILEPLEEEINAIEGLKELMGTARQDVGTVTAEFELWRDIDVAAQDVRDAVERARRQLPDEAESPIVRKLDLDAQAIMWVTLTGDRRWDESRLTDYAENTLKQQIETIRGVGRIQVGGAREYAVRLRIDPERLAAHQITMDEVVDTVQRNNLDAPVGRIEGSRRELLIRSLSRFSEAAPFNDLVITYRNGNPVRIGDVGEVVDGVEDDRRLARYSGEIAVGMGIVKQTGANTVELARSVKQRLSEVEQAFPPGLEYRIAADTSEFVQESIADLQWTVLIAASLVVIVVLGFLRSGRGTIIVAVAIPTSLLIGLAVISVLGFSVNVMTMLGLILVIGIVVDDAIVVLERTYTHLERGAEPRAAARVGTTEVAFPAIANSLALGAVFIPVAFTGGIIGRFFFEFGITVAATVFASTFVALTLSPMLCSRLLRPPQEHGWLFRMSERHLKNIEAAYAWLLRGALRYRGLTVAVGLGAFALGLLALSDTSREFAPDEDRARMMIIFETPRGSTIGETDRFARKIEDILADTPEVAGQFLAIGLGRGGPGSPNSGMAFVTLTPRQERDLHQSEVMQNVRRQLAELADGRAFVRELTPGGIGGSPVEVVMRSPDLDQLAELQAETIAWMERQPQYVGVRTNLELDNPRIDFVPDRDRLGEMGISAADINRAKRYLFGNVEISRIEREAQRYPVVTDVKGRGELSPEALNHLYVRTRQGDLVPLENLGRVVESIGPNEINRFNRMRAATISASTPPGVPLGEAVERLEAHLNATLPPGTDFELIGQSQVFEESFYYLTITIIMAIVFIYLVLAAQFESFFYPFTIMLALPLATIGAFGSLWALGMPLNVYAFIGMIMLMGLVSKNSILLIDYTNVLVRRGRPVKEAAYEAARERFRPVVMTACSTILGMTPIALGLGAGGEARSPLGISVAAGLIGATALTLVVIPVAYTLMDRVQTFILSAFTTHGDEGVIPSRTVTGAST